MICPYVVGGMAFLPRSPASVCLTCGDKGDIELLIYCRKCRDSAVHHYCLDNVSPDDDNINWCCWDCATIDTNPEPSRKSKRIITKQQKVLTTRNHWRQRLNQKKRQVQISDGVDETVQLTIESHSPVADEETQLFDERQGVHVTLEAEKSRSEIPSHSEILIESNKVNELTFARESTLLLNEESCINPSVETQEIQDFAKNRNLVLDDGTNSQEEDKTTDIQVSSLATHMTSETLYYQESSKPDYCFNAEPVIDPIWRGWFNIKEENETCLEILAHLSNKACQKVSEAATSIPTMLDTEFLDKSVAWPKRFRILPPTASSIALYFFPARARDEGVFDCLLDEVIERNVALKAMINDVELLIFSSRELPIQNWRYHGKYYLWGVFRQKQSSRLPKDSDHPTQQNSSTARHWKCAVANNEHLVHSESGDNASSPSQPNQSPLSMKSSQASNLLNTLNYLSSPSLELNGQKQWTGEA